MGKKAIDSRIPVLIRNGVQLKERSFFVIVGDKARNQLPNLHFLMMLADLKMNKLVLWAYKKELLGFTLHRKKREAKIKKEIKQGRREPNTQDPFETFILNQQVRYVYYKETEKILGNTYGMCILQDFEALLPNLLARTVETVEGGGLVVILLKSMASLKQLYTMLMDIHARYRTEAHNDVVARFNERFLLLLGDCNTCLVVDDELNVLPVSGGRHVQALPPADEDELTPQAAELATLKEELAEVQPAGLLVGLAKTTNQAKAILTFIDAISEKTLLSTVALTAGRGRGKSAALGISMAAAVLHGYLNIFVTLPLPENLKTLFEFVFRGFDALGYMEHTDYDIIQSTNPAFNKAIVRVDIKHADHRQTIQYILPSDAHVLGQAELVVIDEAAAIPLPVVKLLLGPYLVFMLSTVNGYEGTGRLLSLKLIKQLRDQAQQSMVSGERGDDTVVVLRGGEANASTGMGRTLREVVLDEPIRYAPGDPVEAWLNKLLCLDAQVLKLSKGTPHPLQCDLWVVNRDTLFLYHPALEAFLQKMMALYVALHYKNTPNDLQLMSDAPAHQLYVLLPPGVKEGNRLPEPLCVVQVCLEGQISKESVRHTLARGQRASGDLIPWLVLLQFQDDEFALLLGARVVRIAVHPDYAGMGYGLRALELLSDYFEGKFTSVLEQKDAKDYSVKRVLDQELAGGKLTDEVKFREGSLLPPLLLELLEQPPYFLHYLGVLYGLTPQLHKFWKRSGYRPVYLRQTANELTGEHTCVMLRVLANRELAWLDAFAQDFHKRFLLLLLYEFSKFAAVQALNVIESTGGAAPAPPVDREALDQLLLPFDLKRLDLYANNLVDYHVIVDMLPLIARLYFGGRLLDTAKLLGVQLAILLAIGLQHKTVDAIAVELRLPNNQAMAMFAKIVRKVSTHFRKVLSLAVAAELPDQAEEEERFAAQVPLADLEQELADAGDEATRELREKQRTLIDAIDLSQYGVDGEGFNAKLMNKAVELGGVVLVKEKKSKRKHELALEIYELEMKHVGKKGKKSKKPRA